MQRKDLIFMAHSVKLSAIIQEYGLDLICTPEGYENVEITVPACSWPDFMNILTPTGFSSLARLNIHIWNPFPLRNGFPHWKV